jgi:hypothetical protein
MAGDFVDWEIKATLDKEHGLIGINLPTNPRLLNGNATVPNRLSNSDLQLGRTGTPLRRIPHCSRTLLNKPSQEEKHCSKNQFEVRTRNGRNRVARSRF